VDRMNKIDEHYQDKIRVLEDRLLNAEREVQMGNRNTERVVHENLRLKNEITEAKTQYIDDLSKNLREQEARFSEKLDNDSRNREKHMGDTNKQNDVLLNRVEELRQEKFRLNEELNNTRRETELFQEEKENLSLNYQNLLNIHNQMIQLDINRNEKNLKNSMHSVANSDIKSTPHNGKRSTARMVEDENMKVLYESLQAYKQELEYLKENNNSIKDQFHGKIEKLRDELKIQQEHNSELLEKVRKHYELQKVKVKSNLNGTIKDDFEMTLNPEMVKDEDLTKMDKSELASGKNFNTL